MPAAHPPEFRRRALDLVAQENPVGQTVRDLRDQRVLSSELDEPGRGRQRPQARSDDRRA